MLVFIDESGKPHPKDSTENPVLCAVCINERDIKHHYYGKARYSVYTDKNIIAQTLQTVNQKN